MSLLLLLKTSGGGAPPMFSITLVSPAAGAADTTARPTFTVLPDSNDGSAMQIQWEWDTASDFTNPKGLKQSKTTSGNADGVNASTTPDADLPPMSMYWRARCGDGTTWSAWTPARLVECSMGTTGAWAWTNPTANLTGTLALAGTGAWAWNNPTADLKPTLQLAASGAWAWNASGHLTVPVPVAPPPATLTSRATTLYRRSETYPDPTPFLVNGVPNPDLWKPTVGALTPIGRPRVTMRGTDVTYLRGGVVEIESITDREPFGDAEMTLRFGQILGFEARGAGDLAPFVDGAEVDCHLVATDGTTIADTWFEGLVIAWEVRDGALVAVCSGALYQLDLYDRAPGISDSPLDVGTLIPFNYNPSTRPHLRIAQMPYLVTGITSRDRGAWDDGVQSTYVARLLTKAVTAAGDEYTVALERPRRPVMRLKDRTTVGATVSFGARGVVVELQREVVQAPNVWYAEGEDEAGTRWRRGYPSTDGTGIFFLPLEYDGAVQPFDDDGAGGLVVDLARLDLTKLRIEGYANFGQGVSVAEAKRVLQGLRARMANPPWLGTIRLDADPEEISRHQLRAGINIRVRWFEGSGSAGVVLHIVEVNKSRPDRDGTVTLTVDQAARNADQVTDLIERLRSAGSDPVKRLIVGRDSAITKVATIPWDTDGGSGWVPRKRKFDGVATVTVPHKTWTVQRILAAEEEDVWKVAFATAPAALFHVGVFDRPPKGMPPTAEYWTGVITDMPRDPMVDGAFDGDKPEGLLMAWGQFGQAAGYSPGTQTNPFAGQTGRLEDYTPWQISHKDVPANERQPAFLWIAVWAHDQATSFWGRIHRGGNA